MHFVPFVSGGPESGYTFHGNLLRYDTTGAFDDQNAWRVTDVSSTSGLRSVGYNAGAYDGRFFYFAPWQTGTDPHTDERDVHGRMLRYDTTDDHARFSLRYCDYGHNGGLCAAVTGPSFLVNTDRGVVGAWAHEALEPGFHHLVGTYDGKAVRLFVDGRCVASRETHGAPIAQADLPVTVGRIQDRAAVFDGEVLEWNIRPWTHTEPEIRAMAEARLATVTPQPPIAIELQTYQVLARCDTVAGKVRTSAPHDEPVRLTITPLDSDEACWDTTFMPGASHDIAVPVNQIDGGTFRVRAACGTHAAA